MTPVRLEPAALRSRVKHSTTEPLRSLYIFYGDLVYKFKRIVGKPNFCDQFTKIIKRYKKVEYNGNYAAVCMPGCKSNHGL